VLVIDISVPIAPTLPVYPGDPPPRIARIADCAHGDLAIVSTIAAAVHVGTHVDAPSHFLPDGGGVETLPLDALIGEAVVVDVTAARGHLDRTTLERLGLAPGERRVLFKTVGEDALGRPHPAADWIGILPDGAAWLVEQGVRLVGVDTLSCAPLDDPAPTHQVLLRAGVVILEGLDLRSVAPGRYHLVCLPLRIPGADGSPARAVLLVE
jgi:arylformamidase